MKKAGKPRKRVTRPAARKGPLRQRQRLIDACISALHIYGPSRTTVGKVVAFAKMSPGIVRFYFDSKAALLVASLQYLATEFEQQVLVPVSKLKSTPVAALQLMVDLFLDADFASPRKVSAWYTFWGEASSRQEYYDICGQKDESFALLVHELIAALIAETHQPHLDADGIALGLIGVLEILWQDIAFQTERDLDRPAAKRRCMAYLRSVFPTRFATPPTLPTTPERFGAWAYADSRLFAQERDLVFSPAWAVVGHACQLPHPGDFLAVDLGSERVLVLRDASGDIRALRGDLASLKLRSVQGLLFVRAPPGSTTAAAEDPSAWFDGGALAGLMMMRPPLELEAAADWKLIVEQWLEAVPPTAVAPDSASPVWYEPAAGGDGWTAARYRGLMDCLPSAAWCRQFLAPNQLLETRPDGLSVIQVWPIAVGRCLVRRLDYSVLPPDAAARAVLYLAARLDGYARRSTLTLAGSTQSGIVEFGHKADGGRPVAPAVAWFRRRLAAQIPSLRLAHPPTGS